MMMMIIPQAMCMCIKMLSIVKKTNPLLTLHTHQIPMIRTGKVNDENTHSGQRTYTHT